MRATGRRVDVWTCGRSVGDAGGAGGAGGGARRLAALEMHHLVPKLGMWVWVAPSRSVESVAPKQQQQAAPQHERKKKKTKRAATRQGSWLAGLAMTIMSWRLQGEEVKEGHDWYIPT